MYALSPESKSSAYLYEHVSSATLLAPAVFFQDLQSEQILKWLELPIKDVQIQKELPRCTFLMICRL